MPSFSKEFKISALLLVIAFLAFVVVKGDLGFFQKGFGAPPARELTEANNTADKDETEPTAGLAGGIFPDKVKATGTLPVKEESANKELKKEVTPGAAQNEPAPASIAGIKALPEGGQEKIEEIEEEKVFQREMYPVALNISGEKFQTSVLPGSTGFDLMESLRHQGKISFSGDNFSGLGFFIKEINGLKNSAKTGEYWMYYINGKSASVGISGYVLKSGDEISWKYDKQ